MLIQNLVYQDCPAAIDWLCNVLQFEVKMNVVNDDGSVAHAQLLLHNQYMLMLSSERSGNPTHPFERFYKSPKSLDGMFTASIYIVVSDPTQMYHDITQHNVNIVLPLEKQSYGGSGFTIADHEHNLWSIGDYNPFDDTSH